MLRAFNARLTQINRQLDSTFSLQLKLIAHYGPVAEYVIKGFRKLYGNAVVEAHVLLKNDIGAHSYALLTDELIVASGRADEEMLPNGLKSHSLCTVNGDIRNLCYTYFDY